MEPDLASEAAELTQAAPIAGADNEKEREKSVLLEQMDGVEGAGEGDEAAAPPEPAPEAVEPEPEDPALAEARRKAREAVGRDFPETLAEGSDLAAACREELEYLREAGSPLADDPEAEYKIARRMSRLLGKGARAAAPEQAPKAAHRSVRPIPAGGTPVESPATVLERRVAGAKSTGDMLSLLREIGTPFEALLKRS
ncbi:MAG: hypothetical protein ACFUZC_03130 [Chthoniobacteraceae bacterium]